MPISIDYDKEKNIIFTKAEGVIKLEDIKAYFSSAANLGLSSGYRVLADYSVADLELSSKDIQEMASQRKVLLNVDSKDKVNIAVHCEIDLVFGLGRMYGALLDEDKFTVRIFRDQEEARKWLDI